MRVRPRSLAAIGAALVLSAFALLAFAHLGAGQGSDERARLAAARVLPALQPALRSISAAAGDPVYLRIFKHESELELWIQPGGLGEFKLFKRYPICAWSGQLGPKMREGDLQAPEGFYWIERRQLNPRSRFHLSFNLGYPNLYERAQGWTGSALMVHGACVSIGCYAMTDAAIEEIYTLLERAIAGGQRRVPVHAFPFRMTAASREQFADPQHQAFWDMLQPVYSRFQRDRVPPQVEAESQGYRITGDP